MTRPLRIALGDLAYLHQPNRHNLYVPLNVGYIASYTQAKYGDAVELSLFKDPEELLAVARNDPPDLVGLAFYYWNAELNKLVSRKLKQGNIRAPIILGGPSIDVDHNEQLSVFERFDGVDAIIPNEGEIGFSAIVGAMMDATLWQKPLPGVVFKDHDKLIKGAPVGLSTDLSKVPSPYLTGFMDPFLGGLFKPMIQTARLCPYTCSFCVSGKDRGKLRAFEPELVKDEVAYIAKHFQGDKNTLFYLTDENFGILERDLQVADNILSVKNEFGFPNRVYFYNDKRFTQIARDVHEKFTNMVWHGVCLSLQSENPETLKAIKRRNLTDEQVVSALSWAKARGLKTSTELIFGLPMETKASFLAILDKCAWWGFDVINCYNLMIFDGIEMNRQKYREEHKLKTRWRVRHADWIDGELCVDREEVVVASNSFSEDDYRLIWKINFMLQSIFVDGLHKNVVMQLIASGVSLMEFLLEFLTPIQDRDPSAQAHRLFLDGLDKHLASLTYDDHEFEAWKAGLRGANTDVAEPCQQRGLAEDVVAPNWIMDIFMRCAMRMDERAAA